tara:strand:+ start:1383 stop:1883 length:501 start_codon:yes stop_codon:yes gene_type:complete
MDTTHLFRDVIAPYINLGIFLFLAVWLFKKPLKEMVGSRRESFEKLLNETKKARVEAENQQNELTAKFDGMSDEISRLRAENQQLIVKENAEAKAKAKELAFHIEVEAKKLAAAEIKKAKETLALDIAAQLKSIVESRIAADVDAGVQHEIVSKKCAAIQSMTLEG